MLNVEFLKKVKDLTIIEADNGLWYLEPEWKQIILDEGLKLVKGTTWADVEDILKLEVVKRNTIRDTHKVVMDWLFELITANVEPAILQEETDYIKQVIEFMRANHELKMNGES